MKKFIISYKCLFLSAFMFFASCEDILNTDAQDSPNALILTAGDIPNYTNSVQVKFKNVFNQATGFSMELVRMRHMFGPLYTNAFVPTSYNDFWEFSYSRFLQDADALIKIAGETEYFMNMGIAQILKAYVLFTLVDAFGDIPYEMANSKVDKSKIEFLNPPLTPGLDVYKEAYALLLAGAENVQKGPAVSFDLYYNGVRNNWTKLANTLRLKAVLLAGDKLVADRMKELETIAALPLITASGDDFQFRYSVVKANPDSRHPFFSDNYQSGASAYIPNYFMSQLLFDKASTGKPVRDPRTRYYLYRQTINATTDQNEMPCISEDKPKHYSEGDVFCLNQSGYWGRDHGDNDGIPPDNKKRTAYGIYPGGGRFDADQGVSATEVMGGQGAGINPIMLSSYTSFMLALASLEGANVGDAWTHTNKAINASMQKVFTFPVAIGYNMTQADVVYADVAQKLVTDYLAVVEGRFNAGSVEDKKNVVCKEYLLAAFGNGIEPYNNYRKYGYPNDMQPLLKDIEKKETFIKSYYYPAACVDRNSNVEQKTIEGLGKGPFWDAGLTLK